MNHFVDFKYYVHDDTDSIERKAWLEQEIGFELSEDLMDKIGRPFEEVTLHCTLNTQTGEVTVNWVKL